MKYLWVCLQSTVLFAKKKITQEHDIIVFTQGLAYRNVSPDMGSMYRYDRGPMRGPPYTEQYTLHDPVSSDTGGLRLLSFKRSI